MIRRQWESTHLALDEFRGPGYIRHRWQRWFGTVPLPRAGTFGSRLLAQAVEALEHPVKFIKKKNYTTAGNATKRGHAVYTRRLSGLDS